MVDVLFFCSYGYNILIEDGVKIGFNCKIEDDCLVLIGKECIFEFNIIICVSVWCLDLGFCCCGF